MANDGRWNNILGKTEGESKVSRLWGGNGRFFSGGTSANPAWIVLSREKAVGDPASVRIASDVSYVISNHARTAGIPS